jgi:nucleotide-binding universal stress UspA family protein
VRPPTILVPLDGTTQATAALPVARMLAGLEGATLHLVHIGEPGVSAGKVPVQLGLAPEQLRGCVLDYVSGPYAERIIQLAAERASAFIVLCSHTASLRRSAVLGSVAEEVVVGAACPVVLVSPARGQRAWTLRRILLPHDGTPTTAAALGPTAELAYRAGAELLVLHVAAPGVRQPAEPGTLVTPRYVDQEQHEWASWAREFLERLTALGHCPAAVQPRLLVGAGAPAGEIVRTVEQQQCDLVALGWRGHLRAERAATLKAVLRNTGAPVLLLRVAR